MEITKQSLNDNLVSVRYTDDYIYLADISDIHVGNAYHNQKAFESFIADVQSIPNMYVIIGGDSTDSSSLQSASSVYEETIHGSEQIIKVKELLEPIKDRILFIRSGNHGYERALKQGKVIPEQLLAYLLDKPFFHGHASAFINVNENCYTVGTWHNSKRPNAVEWIQSDITFFEHVHKRGHERKVVAEPNKYTKSWTVKERFDVQAGSFLGWGGYSADKGYRPTTNGTSVVELCGISHKRRIRVYDDIETVKELVALRQKEKSYES